MALTQKQKRLIDASVGIALDEEGCLDFIEAFFGLSPSPERIELDRIRLEMVKQQLQWLDTEKKEEGA